MNNAELVGTFVISLDENQNMIWAGDLIRKEDDEHYRARKVIYEIGEQEEIVSCTELANKTLYMLFENQSDFDDAISRFVDNDRIVKRNSVSKEDFYGISGANLARCLEGWMNG